MSDQLTIASDSPLRTREIGSIIGAALTRGDVVVLSGELGAGKTTLTQGIARGLGIVDHVTSPTFVVAREMPPGGLGIPLLHVDAYRIASIQEWDDLDMDLDGNASVVEWGEQVADGLPSDRVTVQLHGSDDSREISLKATGPRSDRVLAAVREAL
ncbi:MAG: tRNA (adenosine(37)-N6)-threonylcarbamoyltransferase complex ATPase subunit type 1 TsaE [Candidatus Nanopelagicales bacterium]